MTFLRLHRLNYICGTPLETLVSCMPHTKSDFSQFILRLAPHPQEGGKGSLEQEILGTRKYQELVLLGNGHPPPPPAMRMGRMHLEMS